MIAERNALQPKPVVTFCRAIVAKHASNWPLSEQKLAEEFVAFYALQPFPQIQDLIPLGATLGIQICLVPLPEGLRGHNYSFADKRAILVSEQRGVIGTKEHTLLHELREILEYVFRDLGCPTATQETLEERAEEFASWSRIAASAEAWREMGEQARNIKSTWRRRVVYLLLALGEVFHSYLCAHLPQLEVSLPASE